MLAAGVLLIQCCRRLEDSETALPRVTADSGMITGTSGAAWFVREPRDGLRRMRHLARAVNAERSGVNDPPAGLAESNRRGAARGVPMAFPLHPDEGHGFVRPDNSISCDGLVAWVLARCLCIRAIATTRGAAAASTRRILAGAATLDMPA
jgi:hypothetical protein